MSILKTQKLDAIKGFVGSAHDLAVVERSVPEGSADFFKKLAKDPVEVVGIVRKVHALADIKHILTVEGIAAKVEKEALYEPWLRDMATVCKTFCDLDKNEAVGFWLGSERGCKRYHVDFVPHRLLVTYAGKGTEILPEGAGDFKAYETGKPNSKILKNPSARWYVNQWDVAVFRGGEKGVLHRTPDEALRAPTMMLRLDQASFWLPEGPEWSDPMENKKTKKTAAHAKASAKAKKAASGKKAASSKPATKKKAAAAKTSAKKAAKSAKAAVTKADASKASKTSASKSAKAAKTGVKSTKKVAAKTNGAKKKTAKK